MVGGRQPGQLPPACCSPPRSQVRSRRGAGPAESPAEQQGWGGRRRSCLASSRAGESTRNASLQTVLILSRVNKNKKKLGKHSLCCLAIS